MAGVEYGCNSSEGLLHRRRLVQYLSVAVGTYMLCDAPLLLLRLGGRWTTMGTCNLHLFWVKLVVEKALEAFPRWCSAKPEAVVAATSACRACYSGTVRTCRALTDGQLGVASSCELA